MTTPKSRNERIRRRIRKGMVKPLKPEGNVDSPSIIKKSANTDPDGKHKYARNKLKREFVEFYRSGESDNPLKFKKLIESLIDISIENSGNLNLPYKLSRIEELSKIINEQAENSETETEIRTYEIKAKSKQLNELEKIFSTINHLGSIGASRSFKIGVDGDGAAKVKISSNGEEIYLNIEHDIDDQDFMNFIID